MSNRDNYMTNLLNAVGGAPAVEVAAGILYQKILADETINHFFADVDMDAQTRKQKRFLVLLLSDNAANAAGYVRSAHGALVARGLSDAHFDAVAGHLKSTLEELEVPSDVVDQVVAAAAGLREAVLGRAGTPAQQASA